MCEDRKDKIEQLTQRFRELLEEKFPGKGSTLAQIEELTEEIGQAIEAEIEDSAIGEQGDGKECRGAFCACGRKARYVRNYIKEVVTLHGLRRISRAYYSCRVCSRGFAPLDKQLGLDGGGTTLPVRAKIARIAALAPFERCACELRELCGLDVSAKTVERVAEAVGKAIGEEAAARDAEIISGSVPEPACSPERLYVTVDGVMASVDKGWRECKVGAVYETRAAADGRAEAVHIEHTATFGDAEAIGDKLYALAFRRGVVRAKQTVVLGDGARWIWNQARDNFPGAVEIVDFFHAAEHLAEVANSWHGFGTRKAEGWLRRAKQDLLEGRHARVMRSIVAWRPADAEAKKLKVTSLGYFRRNGDRMRYDRFLAEGLHIGSGVAESSCKVLVQARLKQSGMHWSARGAEAMLQLRARWLDEPTVNFAAYAAMPRQLPQN